MDENRESKYINLAPTYCNMLQMELLSAENYDFDTNGVPAILTGPEDTFVISDLTANRVLPYGLARQYAQIDNDPQYAALSVLYNNAISSISADAPAITDAYNLINNVDLMGE